MIDVHGLEVRFGTKRALKEVSFSMTRGEPLAVLGESGAGKTTLARAMMGMCGGTVSGRVTVEGFEVVTASAAALCGYRGRRAALAFQSLGDSLNPQMTVLQQVAEPLSVHGLAAPAAARERARSLLADFGIDALADRYPHQLSGGQTQRVLIAMALITDPDLLILDEPTAALDPEMRLQVLDRVSAMTRGRHLLFITHDVAAARRIAARALVLYGGAVMENGPVSRVLTTPRHPYSRGLLRASPGPEHRKDLQGIPGVFAEVAAGCPFVNRCTQRIAPCTAVMPLPGPDDGVACHRGGIVNSLEARGLRKALGPAVLLDGVDLFLKEGETVAVVGRSGAGKSTLARILAGFEPADEGGVLIDGAPRRTLDAGSNALTVAFVPQTPRNALAPHFDVRQAVQEPLDIQRSGTAAERLAAVRSALADAQLPQDDTFLRRGLHGLSGGELQRLLIARALVVGPRILVADEPTSALDPSVQAKILRLLMDAQERRGLSIVFVTHDLDVAHTIADRILVLHGGRLSALAG